MPALDDESGSEAVSLEGQDTDLESSDFDLSLGDEESGSQVVALDEDEADEGAATAVAHSRKRRAVDVDDAEEIDDLLIEDEIEEEEAAPRRGLAVAPAAPASWGALPAAILAPTVIIMFVVGIMSFELLHSMWGYRQPSKATAFVTKTIAGWFNEKLPD